MRQKPWQCAIACLAAVVGAGFASGREVASFFTRYGSASWALILLAAAVSTLWYAIVCKRGGAALSGTRFRGLYQGFSVLLLSGMGGAMLGAAGEIGALTIPIRPAYSLCVLPTLALAAWLSRKSLRVMAWLGWGLSAALLVAMALAMRVQPSTAVALADCPPWWQGALRAVAYASLNMTLAMGVVRKAGNEPWGRCACRSSVLFGWLTAALLFVANALLLKHPALLQEPLPIVRLLASGGGAGYWLCAIVLYLAVLTSLIAVLQGLWDALPIRGAWRMPAVCALPLAVSLLGFRDIVDGLYPVLGALCFLLVFLPLLAKKRDGVNPCP